MLWLLFSFFGLKIFELRKVLATIHSMGSGYVRQCTSLSGVKLTLLAFLRVLVRELVCGVFIAVFTDIMVYVYYDYMSVSVS